MAPRLTYIGKRHARWVLIGWVLFVLLTALQPCCEGLASLLPHEHPTQGPDPVHEHDQGTTPANHIDDHRHCNAEAMVDELEKLHGVQPKGYSEGLPSRAVDRTFPSGTELSLAVPVVPPFTSVIYLLLLHLLL
jgi:hypothetical protein